jgi:hypothetical protein
MKCKYLGWYLEPELSVFQEGSGSQTSRKDGSESNSKLNTPVVHIEIFFRRIFVFLTFPYLSYNSVKLAKICI